MLCRAMEMLNFLSLTQKLEEKEKTSSSFNSTWSSEKNFLIFVNADKEV